LDFNLSLVRANQHKIDTLLHRFKGRAFEAHYLAYFDCFNRQLYFEAHEVLEPLWLGQRGRPLGLFYKGLIQFAGAFVHLQKRRRGPAIALFDLARRNLEPYGRFQQGIDLDVVLNTIKKYVEDLSKGDKFGALFYTENAPQLFPEDPAKTEAKGPLPDQPRT
jgi:predicted metal-dependent hydrolase